MMFGMSNNPDETTPDAVYKGLKEGRDIFVLDVREPHEFVQVRMDEAVLIPQGNLQTNNRVGYEEEMEQLENYKDKEVVVVCRSGVRSLYATNYLISIGFTNVKSVRSGIIGWIQQGFPVDLPQSNSKPGGLEKAIYS